MVNITLIWDESGRGTFVTEDDDGLLREACDINDVLVDGNRVAIIFTTSDRKLFSLDDAKTCLSLLRDAGANIAKSKG
jgi:hypothetical protein